MATVQGHRINNTEQFSKEDIDRIQYYINHSALYNILKCTTGDNTPTCENYFFNLSYELLREIGIKVNNDFKKNVIDSIIEKAYNDMKVGEPYPSQYIIPTSFSSFTIPEYVPTIELLYNTSKEDEKPRNAIFLENLVNGDTIVDFNKEKNYRRYYKKNTFKGLKGKNPSTRERMNKKTIRMYCVKIKGTTAASGGSALSGGRRHKKRTRKN